MNIRVFKTQLDPNNRQVSELRQWFGARRWAYNRALEIVKGSLGKCYPSYSDVCREIVSLKHRNDELGAPWLKTISNRVPEYAIEDLYRSFDAHWKWKKARKGPKRGFPAFRKRGTAETFTVDGSVKVESRYVKIPKLAKIRLKRKDFLPVGAKVQKATVSEKGGKFWVSVSIKVPEVVIPTPTGNPIGVDVGITTMMALSDGTMFYAAKAEKRFRGLLRRASRKLSRAKKGSQNRLKAQLRVQKIHSKIQQVRHAKIHEATSALIAKAPSIIVLETLNIAGMKRNRKLARALSDAAMGEVVRQIKYKAARAGIKIVQVDRLFPSSKTCSGYTVPCSSSRRSRRATLPAATRRRGTSRGVCGRHRSSSCCL